MKLILPCCQLCRTRCTPLTGLVSHHAADLYTISQSRCENNHGIRDGTLMRVRYKNNEGRYRMISSLRGKRRDVVLDDLLDFSLHLGGDIASRNLFQERTLGSSQM